MDGDFDVTTLVGRTVIAVEVMTERHRETLQLTLDDGRALEICGYTDVFTDDEVLDVSAAT